MEAQLKKYYVAMLAPAVGGFIIVILLRSFVGIDLKALKSLQWVTAPALFALAFTFAVAFPLLIRTLFVNKNRNEKNIPENVLLKFELNTMYVALVAPYIALIAFALETPRFHLAGAILASFYAVYYFFPSHKRIQYEKRIFRAR